MPHYVSDHTQFIRDYLEQNPEQVEEQRKGRALWWDKPQTVEAQKQFGEAKLPAKPNPYFSL